MIRAKHVRKRKKLELISIQFKKMLEIEGGYKLGVTTFLCLEAVQGGASGGTGILNQM